jgi:hypothetical protein
MLCFIYFSTLLLLFGQSTTTTTTTTTTTRTVLPDTDDFLNYENDDQYATIFSQEDLETMKFPHLISRDVDLDICKASE